MSERLACVMFNSLLAEADGDGARAALLGEAIGAQGLRLPRAVLDELVALGPIFDVVRFREVRGVGPVLQRRLIEALTRLAPDEEVDPDAWSPEIPVEVFDALDEIELDELDTVTPDRGRPAPGSEGVAPEEDEEPDSLSFEVSGVGLAAEAPDAPAPDAPLLEAPDAPLLEAPDAPLLEAPDAPLLEAPAPEAPDAPRATPQAPDAVAEGILLRHTLVAGTTGLGPVPLADLALLLAVNVHMLRQLAAHHGAAFHEQRARAAVASLVATAGVPALMLPMGSLLRGVPALGWALGSLATSSVAATLTYATGRVFIRHFSRGGQVQDFDARSARSAFREELARGRRVLKQRHQQV